MVFPTQIQTHSEKLCDDFNSQLKYHLSKPFPDHPIQTLPSHNGFLLCHRFEIPFTDIVTKTEALLRVKKAILIVTVGIQAKTKTVPDKQGYTVTFSMEMTSS